MRRSLQLFVVLHFMIFVSATQAQIPQTMSYQGILTDASGNVVPDGNYSLTFKLYDAATGAGAALWTEAQLIPVSKGIFNVMLGSVSPLTVAFDKQYWLGISVALNPELTPRVQLASAAYSLNTRSVLKGVAVKSLNGLTDAVTLTGGGGATVTSSGNTITITASGGGTGILGVQNSNGTLDITSPNGPTATINVKDKGINTAQLADNAVTAPKIASGQTVKSINSLHDDVTFTAGTNVTITPSGNSLTISATGGGTGGLSAVTHDGTMTGDGTAANPLAVGTITGSNIANSSISADKLSFPAATRPLAPGVSTMEIADDAVTASKIPTGQVVKTINSIHDDVTLAAGTNVTITPSGSTLTISATGGSGGGLSAVEHDATLSGEGTSTKKLSIAVPLLLNGNVAPPDNVLSVTNGTSGGTGVYAQTKGNAIHGSTSGNLSGVLGVSTAKGVGVTGNATGTGDGMQASAVSGTGLKATSESGSAIEATSTGGKAVYASTSDVNSVAVYAENTNSNAHLYAVEGILTSTTAAYSSAAGVHGKNCSTNNYGYGVFGEHAGGGWGILGIARGANGHAVFGEAMGAGGTGVEGYTYVTGGTAVKATNHYIGGVGLELAGQLKVSSLSNGNRAAFIWTITGSSWQSTIIYPSGMGAQSSTDILIVTPVSGGTAYNHPWGIIWDGNSSWQIFSQDQTSIIPSGMKWNILVIRQ